MADLLSSGANNAQGGVEELSAAPQPKAPKEAAVEGHAPVGLTLRPTGPPSSLLVASLQRELRQKRAKLAAVRDSYELIEADISALKAQVKS